MTYLASSSAVQMALQQPDYLNGFSTNNERNPSNETLTNNIKDLDRSITPNANEYLQQAEDKLNKLKQLSNERNALAHAKLDNFTEKLGTAYEINNQNLDNQQSKLAPSLVIPSLPAADPDEVEVLFHSLAADVNAASASGEISADLDDTLKLYIEMAKNSALDYDSFEGGVQGYFAFFGEFNDYVSGMGQYLTTLTDDRGNALMKYDSAVFKGLEDLINKFSDDAGKLYPASGTATKEEAKMMAKAWGMPETCVQEGKNGGWVVKIDISPLTTMLKDMKSQFYDEKNKAPKEINTFQFDTWKNGFAAQSDKLQNNVQILMTRLTTEMGKSDNFMKQLNELLEKWAQNKKNIFSTR